MLSRWKVGEKGSTQKIDDLLALATCRSGTCFPAKLTVLLPMEAFDNDLHGSWRTLTDLTQTFRACHSCTFNVATILFQAYPVHGI